MGRAETLRTILENLPPGPEGPYVYFIEALGTGLVKIGCTINDPRKRLSSLQVDTELKLELRAAVAGYSYQETAIQAMFGCYEGDLLPRELLDRLPKNGWTEWVRMSTYERAILRLHGRLPQNCQRRWIAGPCKNLRCNEYVVQQARSPQHRNLKCWKHDTKAREWEIALDVLGRREKMTDGG